MALMTEYHGVLETQQCKGQDFAVHGKLRNGDIWFAVFDGHGTNTVIDTIRALDFNEVMEKANPALEIQNIIEKIPDTFKSGSTMSMVIICEDKIRCFWKGDSTIKIYKNDEEHYVSKNHDSQHHEEVQRISALNLAMVEDWRTEVLGPSTITMVPSPYYRLSYSTEKGCWDQTNMTNCLGHNRLLGSFIEEKVISLQPNEKYSVIVATDGLWDIVAKQDTHLPLMNDCHELTEFAKQRWRQDWTYEYPGHPSQVTKFEPADDIGIAFWKGNYIPLD